MLGTPSVLETDGDGRPCGACGYDLRGNISGRCPECGARARRGGLGGIPWEHRTSRGTVGAWMATLRLVLGRPTHFARQAQGAVRRAPARQFHRLTLMGTWALVMLLLAGLLAVSRGMTGFAGGWGVAGALLLIVPVVPVGLAVCMWVWRELAVGRPPKRIERLRRRHAAWYGSVVMPVTVVFTLLAIAAWTAAGTGGEPWEWAVMMGIAGTGFAAAAYLCLIMPLMVAAGEWNAGPLRWGIILVLYPMGLVWVGMVVVMLVATVWQWPSQR